MLGCKGYLPPPDLASNACIPELGGVKGTTFAIYGLAQSATVLCVSSLNPKFRTIPPLGGVHENRLPRGIIYAIELKLVDEP